MSTLARTHRISAAASAVAIAASLVAITPAVAAPLSPAEGPFTPLVRVSLVPLNIKACIGNAGGGIKLGPYGHLRLQRC